MRSKGRVGERSFTDQARRTQIVNVAIEAIAELGYPRASVRKIAERVGVAMSVVLYHFANKDELVAAIATELYRMVIAAMAPVVRAEATATGKLHAYIRSNAAFVAEHRSAHAALLDIGMNYRSANGRRLHELDVAAELHDDLIPLDLESIVAAGVRQREFHPIDPHLTAIAVRNAINGAVLEIAHDPEFDAVGYGEELVTLFDLTIRSGP